MKRVSGLAVLVAFAACGDGPVAINPPDAASPSDAAADVPTTGDAASNPDGSLPSSEMWSMGYYAGYEAAKYPVTEIGWNGLTHVAVAFYLPDTKGGLDESLFQSSVEGPKLGHAIVDAAHKAGKKAVASIGGAGMHDNLVASASNANRAAFVARIKKLVGDYGYDGVDIDWEPVVTADATALEALAKDLRAALPAGALLTIPIGTVNHNVKDDLSWVPKIAAAFDQFNLMSYSMAGTYPGWKSWHASPLHWNADNATPTGIDDSVDAFLAAGVPAAKLGLGAGFYGLCYRRVSAPAQALGASTIKASDGAMSYAAIMTQYYSAPAAKWDNAAKVPYLGFAQATGPQGCTYVSYEDAQSLAEKGAYAKSKKLGGIIVWTINQGYLASAPVGQKNPLLGALETAFLKL